MSRFLTRHHVLLAAIVFLAAFFRLYRIDQLPPGFQFDQAFYLLDALKLVQGEFAIFFSQPGKSEPLYQYLLMPWVALVGADSPLALKITAGIIGTLTVPLVYGITRAFFHSSAVDGNGVGLLAAVITAISFWHIFYCRYGERIPLTLFMAILSFWFLWRALSVSFSVGDAPISRPWQNYILTGIFTGLTLYTYPSSRIVPIAIVMILAYAMLANRAYSREYLKGLTIITAIAALVFLPLGIYYLGHPTDFFSHTTDVSIFVPHGQVSDNIPLELAKNALKILGMFFITGDNGVLRNLPGRPIFDLGVGALFVVGVLVWLGQLVSPKSPRIVRLRAVFFAVWLGLALGLSLVSDDAPNNGRVLIGLPVVMILPALGISAIWERVRLSTLRYATFGCFAFIVVASAWFSFRDYFITFANDPATYYTFDTDKVEISDWINRNAPHSQVYLAPLLQQNGTISLLTRNARVQSFESRDTIVLPSRDLGKDALYVFPWEQEKKIQTMADRLSALGTRELLTGSNGGKLVLIYRVPAIHLPNPQSPISDLASGGDFVQPHQLDHAVWDDAFELLGYSIDATDEAKRNLQVTLFFHALKPMTQDYSFSVKARDAQGRVWGQEDKWLGDNSYATTQWTPGDVIIEKFYPGLNACAPAGKYRISVEVYNPQTMQTLAHSEGTSQELGETRAEASPSNRLEDLEPEQPIEKQFSAQLRLMGFTLSADTLQAGAPFSLSLFWRGVGKGNAEKIRIQLQETVIQETTVQIPAEGRGVCSFFDLTVPPQLRPGTAALTVNDFRLTDAEIK